jgi:hypothetical protein
MTDTQRRVKCLSLIYTPKEKYWLTSKKWKGLPKEKQSPIQGNQQGK